MTIEVMCPQCGKPLEEIRYPHDSMLNKEQWESQIAGNWLCNNCPGNGRGKQDLCYFWNKEVQLHPKNEAKIIAELDLGRKGRIADLGLKLRLGDDGYWLESRMGTFRAAFNLRAENAPNIYRFFRTIADELAGKMWKQ